eukprot:3059921-Pleurochrysis_carterae.AAC.1
MISGIIPEWQEADVKKKKGAITVLRSWTGDMMNHARIQMKTWITIKNEHKASVKRVKTGTPVVERATGGS